MESIDWKNLSFGYLKTDCNIRAYYRDGQWSDPEVSDSEFLNLHMAATCLHYGQEAFEGLKTFRGRDGKIRIFRMRDNALRMQSSAQGIGMATVPVDLFERCVTEAVKRNERFVPPADSGASLYVRPLLVGTSAQVGVKAALEYVFLVFVTPVGPYFKEGFRSTAVGIFRNYDRAAPLGTGTFKVGGNYAASLVAGEIAHRAGYSAVLYLDAKEKRFVDECGPANFFAIKDNTYVTPASSSILPSITNKSLMRLAEEFGLRVEQRRIPLEELPTFEEAGMCGTAAVISPIQRIDDVENNRSYVFSADGEPGPVSTRLYQRLRAIQYGEAVDSYGWVTVL